MKPYIKNSRNERIWSSAYRINATYRSRGLDRDPTGEDMGRGFFGVHLVSKEAGGSREVEGSRPSRSRCRRICRAALRGVYPVCAAPDALIPRVLDVRLHSAGPRLEPLSLSGPAPDRDCADSGFPGGRRVRGQGIWADGSESDARSEER